MSKNPSKNPSDWKFKRFRIEPELISQIENLANVRGEQKGDIIAETMEWFIKNRSDGTISPRYFASPNEAPYTGIWVTPDTAKKLIAWRRQIAKTLTELFTQLSQGTSTKTKPDFNRSNERFFFVLSCNRRNGRDPSLTFLRLDKPPARQHFLSYAKLKSFCRISCLTRSGALLI